MQKFRSVYVYPKLKIRKKPRPRLDLKQLNQIQTNNKFDQSIIYRLHNQQQKLDTLISYLRLDQQFFSKQSIQHQSSSNSIQLPRLNNKQLKDNLSYSLNQNLNLNLYKYVDKKQQKMLFKEVFPYKTQRIKYHIHQNDQIIQNDIQIDTAEYNSKQKLSRRNGKQLKLIGNYYQQLKQMMFKIQKKVNIYKRQGQIKKLKKSYNHLYHLDLYNLNYLKRKLQI